MVGGDETPWTIAAHEKASVQDVREFYAGMRGFAIEQAKPRSDSLS